MLPDARDPFAPVRLAVEPLAALPCSWFVVGGWAIDLHLARVSRPHADVDVAVYRRDQAAVRTFLAAGGWEVRQVVGGRLLPWADHEWLALPVHELHATHRDGRRLELLLNEGDDTVWRFRKAPAVTRPRSLVERRTADGVPYLAPEVPLLYKALTAHRRPQDEADLHAALPALAPDARAWLADALRALVPQHPWLLVLGHDPATGP